MSETVVGMAGGIKTTSVVASPSDASPVSGTVKTPMPVTQQFGLIDFDTMTVADVDSRVAFLNGVNQ